MCITDKVNSNFRQSLVTKKMTEIECPIKECFLFKFKGIKSKSLLNIFSNETVNIDEDNCKCNY